MFFSTAKEIWENLCQTYSMKKDIAACYKIENKIFHTSQGSLSVTSYYGMLNGSWIELDQYQNLKMKCTDDSIALAQFLERMRIFKFLSGLNSEFDPIRIQILGKEKLPSVSKVFHIVRGEETRRSVMLDGGKSVDNSALAAGNSVYNSSLVAGNSVDNSTLATGKAPKEVHFLHLESLIVMIVGAAIVRRRVILRKGASNLMERRRTSNVLENSKVPYKGMLIRHHLTLKLK